MLPPIILCAHSFEVDHPERFGSVAAGFRVTFHSECVGRLSSLTYRHFLALDRDWCGAARACSIYTFAAIFAAAGVLEGANYE